MVNVIKMCLCWDIELIWCVHVSGMCNSEIKFWKSNSIPPRACERVFVCEFGVGGVDQTAICATVAWPHLSSRHISWHITFWQWHYHTNRTTKSTWTPHCANIDTSKSHQSHVRQAKVECCFNSHFPKRQKSSKLCTETQQKKTLKREKEFRPWKIDGWPNTISYVCVPLIPAPTEEEQEIKSGMVHVCHIENYLLLVSSYSFVRRLTIHFMLLFLIMPRIVSILKQIE